MSLRAWTYALHRNHQPHLAVSHILDRAADRAAQEALCAATGAGTRIEGPLLARVLLALPRPGPDTAPLIRDTLTDALEHPLPTVRRAAAVGLSDDPRSAEPLAHLLRVETRWPVRAAAAASPHLPPAADLHALTDPHWRARMPVLSRLQRAPRLPDCPPLPHPRLEGALAYLHTLRDPCAPRPPALPEPPPPDVPWWDPDPRVMRRELLRLSSEDLRLSLPHLPGLLHRGDIRLRRIAIEALLRWASPALLRDALRPLADPRTPFLLESLTDLAARLEVERRTALTEATGSDPQVSGPELAFILRLPGAEPLAVRFRDHPHPAARAAAIRHVSDNKSLLHAVLHDVSPEVRCAAAETLGGRLGGVDLSGDGDPKVRRYWAAAVAHEPRWWSVLAKDVDARVRVQAAAGIVKAGQDPGDLALEDDYRVRQAALTPARAEALWRDPEQETAWAVLAAAARVLQRPLSLLAPPAPPAVVAVARPSGSVGSPQTGVAQRRLGATGLWVAPLGLSGHYGLDEVGFAEGLERGVNLLFWEPAYLKQTRFLQALPRTRREALVLLTGSYDAEPRVVRRDLERTLRLLQVDRVALFLIFWVRSRRRIDPAVQEVLENAQMLGQIGAYGLSTHQRDLAVEAVAQGWPLIMTRHNGAHRGAELSVFPAVQAATPEAPGLITFSNLCYGRMLRDGVRAEDCYRYSLSFPAVGATLSAPGSHTELRDNLAVLEDATLSAASRARVLEVGERLYRQQQDFAHGVRWR